MCWFRVSTAVFAFTTFAGGRWQTFPVLSVTMFVAGVAWIQILASLNVSAQTMCPGHMRARAISMYLLVLQGGLAGGAALWGEIAERLGMARSLSYAALGLGVGMLATFWFRLRSVRNPPQRPGNGLESTITALRPTTLPRPLQWRHSR